jgi:hypothetical protein
LVIYISILPSSKRNYYITVATFGSDCFGQLVVNWEIDFPSPLEPGVAALINAASMMEQLDPNLLLHFEVPETPYEDARFGIRQLLIRRVRFTTEGESLPDNYRYECDQQVDKLCRAVIQGGAWMGFEAP